MVLSLFPTLFDWALLAPVILRLAASLIFFAQAKTALGGNKKPEAGVRFIIGALLLLGLYTQGAALAGLIALIIWDFKNKTTNRHLTLLLGAVLLSLLFLGAGLFAFDLPL